MCCVPRELRPPFVSSQEAESAKASNTVNDVEEITKSTSKPHSYSKKSTRGAPPTVKGVKDVEEPQEGTRKVVHGEAEGSAKDRDGGGREEGVGAAGARGGPAEDGCLASLSEVVAQLSEAAFSAASAALSVSLVEDKPSEAEVSTSPQARALEVHLLPHKIDRGKTAGRPGSTASTPALSRSNSAADLDLVVDSRPASSVLRTSTGLREHDDAERRDAEPAFIILE